MDKTEIAVAITKSLSPLLLAAITWVAAKLAQLSFDLGTVWKGQGRIADVERIQAVDLQVNSCPRLGLQRVEEHPHWLDTLAVSEVDRAHPRRHSSALGVAPTMSCHGPESPSAIAIALRKALRRDASSIVRSAGSLSSANTSGRTGNG